MDLGFVLVRTAAAPDPTKIVGSAKRLGFALTFDATKRDRGMLSFTSETTLAVVVAVMPIAHPDAPQMPHGPTSPAPDEVAACKAHLIVTVLGLDGPERERDTTAAALIAAVVENVDAVGAMLGHGVIFHRADFFAAAAEEGIAAGALPVMLAIDVTAARRSATAMSFLTHGMQRYGLEELWVTCAIADKGALEFLFDIAGWLLDQPTMRVPTGDTVGRNAGEKVRVERVASPTGTGPDVMWLDLSASPS